MNPSALRSLRGDGDAPRARDGRRSRTSCDHDDPDALDRRRPDGQFGPPRRAHGGRPDGVRAVDAVPALRAPPPRLAEPRPLRAVRGPRLDAARLAPPPDGLRPAAV